MVELYQAGTASERIDYKQLQRRHFDWLASLQPTMTYRDDVFLCHGAPKNDTTFWLDRVTQSAIIEATPIEDVEAEASGVTASLILCGHTHIPRVVRLRDGRLVVNAGSVVALDTMAASQSRTRSRPERLTPVTPFSNAVRRDGALRFGTCLMTTCRWLNWHKETNSQYGPVRWPQAGFGKGAQAAHLRTAPKIGKRSAYPNARHHCATTGRRIATLGSPCPAGYA
jgi:hypothetical protein